MDGDSINYQQGRKQPENHISFLGQNNAPESCLYYAPKEKAQMINEENSPGLKDQVYIDQDNNETYSYYPHVDEPHQTTPYEHFMSQLCDSMNNKAAISYNNNNLGAISYSQSTSRRSSPAFHSISLADSGIVSGSPDSRGSPLSTGAANGSRSSPFTYGGPPGFENAGDNFREVFEKDFEVPNSGIQRLHIPGNDSASTDSDDEIYYSDTEDFYQQPAEKNGHQISYANDNNQIDESLESNYYSAENNEIINHNEIFETENTEESKAEEMVGEETFTDLSNKVNHKLSHEYCFWYWKRGGKSTLDYSAHLHLMTAFQSIEDFWAIYSHIIRPDKVRKIGIRSGIDFHVFRKGIRPVWEDDVNKGGGKWMVRLPKGKCALYWENLLLAVLGDQFMAASQYICGVVVSIRFKEEILALWIKSTKDAAVTNYICDIFRKVLKMSHYEGNVFEYKAHEDSLKDETSFQNTDIFIH